MTYEDEEKKKCISLLTNDFDMPPEDIVAIYRQRWEIELLFKQIKQNFPLHFFYGESANAIKIQIWVMLIANLLLTIMQRSLNRRWSFSNLATTMRIMLMYYVDFHSFFENPKRARVEDTTGSRRTAAAVGTRILGGAWFCQSESVTLIYR